MLIPQELQLSRKKPHVNHTKGLTKLYIMYKSRRTTPAAFFLFRLTKIYA